MTQRPYTKLIEFLANYKIIAYHYSGPAQDNLGKQVHVEIADELDSGQGVRIYFNIAPDGTETFVCQE